MYKDRKQFNAYCRTWSKNNIRKVRTYNWKKKGMINMDGSFFTSDDFDNLYQQQSGLCALCGMHSSAIPKGLCADHDHKTGKVRGLLCPNCNKNLGTLENKEFCLKASLYLQS